MSYYQILMGVLGRFFEKNECITIKDSRFPTRPGFWPPLPMVRAAPAHDLLHWHAERREASLRQESDRPGGKSEILRFAQNGIVAVACPSVKKCVTPCIFCAIYIGNTGRTCASRAAPREAARPVHLNRNQGTLAGSINANLSVRQSFSACTALPWPLLPCVHVDMQGSRAILRLWGR